MANNYNFDEYEDDPMTGEQPYTPPVSTTYGPHTVTTNVSPPTDTSSEGYQEYLRRTGGEPSDVFYSGPGLSDPYANIGKTSTGYLSDTAKTPKTVPFKYTIKAAAPVQAPVDMSQVNADKLKAIANTPIGQFTRTDIIAPEGPAPTLGPAAEFAKPEFDERAIAKLAQRKAAPGVRRLRQSMQQVFAAPFKNPAARGMTLRDALSGYGQGLTNVMAGAESQARAEYGQEYQTEYQAAVMGYEQEQRRMMAEFNAAWNNYMKQYTTATTTGKIYPESEMGRELQQLSGVPATTV